MMTTERMDRLKHDLDNLMIERSARMVDLERQSKSEHEYTEKELAEIDEQIDDIRMLMDAEAGWKAVNKYVGRRYS